MEVWEQIECRVSRRSYLPDSVPPEARTRLEARMAQLNQDYGLSFAWLEDGAAAFDGFGKSYGMFRGVRSLILCKGPAADPDLEEKLGYAGELLVLEATALDLGTCWVGWSYDRKCPLVPLDAGERLALVIAVGLVPADFTRREQFLLGVLHRRERGRGAIQAPSGETLPDWFVRGVSAVLRAPSARNRRPWRIAYHDGSVRLTLTERKAFALVDLGIAKAHFVLAAGGQFDWGDGGTYTRDAGE
ncbi:MAG: nitroreductase [Oscillospiraceae bacterium]|jgi:nitroreductase|nr:nitroreductase [Oscillospiraceae bacterium]